MELKQLPTNEARQPDNASEQTSCQRVKVVIQMHSLHRDLNFLPCQVLR